MTRAICQSSEGGGTKADELLLDGHHFQRRLEFVANIITVWYPGQLVNIINWHPIIDRPATVLEGSEVTCP